MWHDEQANRSGSPATVTPHPRALREALNKTKILLLLTLLVIGACADPKDRDPDPAEQAPDPIGPELINLVGGWNYCSSGAHLYREGRALQFQCFDGEGVFVYENRGTLTPEAAATLDAELMAADLNDTEPVNYLGSCG